MLSKECEFNLFRNLKEAAEFTVVYVVTITTLNFIS